MFDTINDLPVHPLVVHAVVVLPLLAMAVALAWRSQRSAAADSASPRAGRSSVKATISILAVVITVADLMQVYRVGDSGARAAWSDVGSATPATRRGR